MAEEKLAGLGNIMPRFPELDTQPFWDATKNHELRYQQCDKCEGVIFYPRRHCVHCTSVELSAKLSSGEGEVYTYSVVRRSRNPDFKGLVPYWIAWVDLDEGFRILTHIVDVDEAKGPLKIGQRVRVEWIDCEDLAFPVFRSI